MERISKWCFSIGGAVSIAALLLVIFMVQPARADQVDPTVTTGYSMSASSSITETSNSWVYTTSASVPAPSGTIYFLDSAGDTWSSLQVVATMDSTSGHTFTCDLTQSPSSQYGTQAYNSCSLGPETSTTETFSYSLGPGVAGGDYLVFNWFNFPTDSGNNPVPVSFDFTATSAAVPEPGSMLLLGTGLLGLKGMIRRKKKL